MQINTELKQATQAGVERYGELEWRTRVDLAACYRLVEHFGMCDLISNHISARVPGTDDFLINPFGLMYEEISASNLIRVDLAGNVLDNPNEAYSINRAGYVIHSAVHEARPDVGCVIHTHTVAGIAVSTLQCGVLPISQSAMRFAKIAYHDFEGVAFDDAEKLTLVADLGDADAMILRNHGLLAVGSDIAQAFNTIYRLERVCQIQTRAMACNSPLVVPADDLVQKAYGQYMSNPVAVGKQAQPLGAMEWPAMLRLLDRRDPSFRM